MNKAIQPELVTTAVRCQTCGAELTFATARPGVTVDVCRNCHPAYTGVSGPAFQRSGRIERFERRLERARRPVRI